MKGAARSDMLPNNGVLAGNDPGVRGNIASKPTIFLGGAKGRKGAMIL